MPRINPLFKKIKKIFTQHDHNTQQDKQPIRKQQKKVISHKINKNPNKPLSKKFPDNLPLSDYVTIEEKKFKKMSKI